MSSSEKALNFSICNKLNDLIYSHRFYPVILSFSDQFSTLTVLYRRDASKKNSKRCRTAKRNKQRYKNSQSTELNYLDL